MPADGPRGMESGFPPKGVAAGIVAAIVIADQWTKWLVQEHVPLYGSVRVIDGFLDLIHVRNTGVAFGLLNSVDIPFKAGLMTAVALAALVALGIYATQLSPRETLARFGLTLVAGGAVGNLIDRATAGYVVDFVDVYWGGWHFWAFNVADAAITVGASCLIFELLFLKRHVSEAA
ncbi:MAG: signal peptidase II [Acidobacteria bacterium]|nr:signal peptidase II [Acidobacteriota bacterium]